MQKRKVATKQEKVYRVSVSLNAEDFDALSWLAYKKRISKNKVTTALIRTEWERFRKKESASDRVS